MATAVPRGMRSIAARKAMVTSPVVTPRARRVGRSRRRTSRSGGRARARKTSAPMVSRSQAVPAGPTIAIRSTDRAEPSWTDSIAVTARAHGGTGARCAVWRVTAGPRGDAACQRSPGSGAPSAAIRRRATRTSGPSLVRWATRSSPAASSAWSLSGPSASRMNSAVVVWSVSWVRRA